MKSIKFFIIFSIFIFSNSFLFAQNFVCIGVNNANYIYLQQYGGQGPVYECHCVEPNDLLPYPGLGYVSSGGGFFACDDAAYQDVSGTAICDVTATAVSTNTSCNANTGSVTINASGGSGSFEFNFNNQGWVSQNIYNNLSSGTYTYSARNSDGSCETAVQNITVNNQVSNLTITASPTPCNTITNKHDVAVSIAGSGFPTTGNLVISIGSQSQTVNSPFQNPTNVTITNLISNGQSNVPVVAVFSAYPDCTVQATYAAPATCTNCPPIQCGTTTVQKN